MYVTMMMTDPMPLELPPPLLGGEVALMPPMVNGDTAQQVILVQVNPGETFTIRAEDGSLQCIQEACFTALHHRQYGHFTQRSHTLFKRQGLGAVFELSLRLRAWDSLRRLVLAFSVCTSFLLLY
ncbi:hypothetical protein MHYP_G00203550 [Metynnis hypsauchen]